MCTNLIKHKAAAKLTIDLKFRAGLFAAKRDSLEALEPSDALLNAGAGLVEGAGDESRLVAFVGFVGNDGAMRRFLAASRWALLA